MVLCQVLGTVTATSGGPDGSRRWSNGWTTRKRLPSSPSYFRSQTTVPITLPRYIGRSVYYIAVLRMSGISRSTSSPLKAEKDIRLALSLIHI